MFYKYLHFSLCEDNCIYDKIDFENMIISCICSIKNNMNINLTKDNKKNENEKKDAHFQNIVLDILKHSSYEVIKCYNLVFRIRESNSGFWIYSILILINIAIIISYLITKEEPINNYIMKEMAKFHYIERIKKPLKKN